VGVPDHEWGTEVVAVTDGSGSVSELRRYLRQTLPVAAAPRRLARLNALPRTSSGKIDRQRLIHDLTAPDERYSR
jgi:acyl-CoA synthetase (AMP-forming)/AMP-acid ligase II